MTTDTRRDLGNIVTMSISNQIEKQPHFKSSGGRRTKDAVRVTQVGATIKATLDELYGKNISIFALGSPEERTDGSIDIEGLTDTVFEGLLEFIGDNEQGVQIKWTGKVSFVPSGDFVFIADNNNYNTLQIEAEVIEDDTYGFGLWSVVGGAVSPDPVNYTIATGKCFFTRTA